MREPAFWWREPGLAAGVLAPLAAIYGAVAARRMARQGRRAGVPVVCIGNPTVGGAGKTPLALLVARMLEAVGERPVLLSRGYGGKLPGPLQVDPLRHRAADVGDEPLLLAGAAPTIVARDRVAGAAAARCCRRGHHRHGRRFPESVAAEGFFHSGGGCAARHRQRQGHSRRPAARAARRAARPRRRARRRRTVRRPVGAGRRIILDRGIPVFRAALAPDAGRIAALGGGRVLAFAGIGDPEKFFATLRDAGITVAATRGFSDHHRYTAAEAAALCEHADREGLILVTTEKDAVRLRGDDAVAALAAHAQALPVTLVLDDEAGFKTLLLEKIIAARGTQHRNSARSRV